MEKAPTFYEKTSVNKGLSWHVATMVKEVDFKPGAAKHNHQERDCVMVILIALTAPGVR